MLFHKCLNWEWDVDSRRDKSVGNRSRVGDHLHFSQGPFLRLLLLSDYGPALEKSILASTITARALSISRTATVQWCHNFSQKLDLPPGSEGSSVHVRFCMWLKSSSSLLGLKGNKMHILICKSFICYQRNILMHLT